MSASSSRSQSASSPGSKAAAATSSPVKPLRDFDSESRRREKRRPPLSSSTSGAASGSPSSSAQLRGELPLLVANEGDLSAVREHCVHLELRPADHEVHVGLRDVHPFVRLPLERSRNPESVGDVAGGVLVEQRVVEERARLADTRVLRHERELAEAVGILDVRVMAADHVRTRLGVYVDDPPVLEHELEATDELPTKAERHGRAKRSLGPAR